MARDLFGDVTAPSVKVGSQAWYTVPLSVAAHLLAAAVLLVVPLMGSDLVPIPQTVGIFVEPRLPDPPPPPPAPAPAASARATEAPASTAVSTEPPSGITPEVGRAVGVPGVGIEGGIGSLADGIGTGLVNVPTPPTPPPAPPPQAPVRPGGSIKYPAKIQHVPPVYPRIAQDARVSGIVILEAVIGIDGRVQDVKVLRSKPLLDQAAIDAVRQWRFTPTLLNGVPVPVILTVTVNFELQ